MPVPDLKISVLAVAEPTKLMEYEQTRMVCPATKATICVVVAVVGLMKADLSQAMIPVRFPEPFPAM